MITGDELVTELAKYVKSEMEKSVEEFATGAPVFKYRKPNKHSGEYIVVNHLPITYGKFLNDLNYLNVNIHVPETKSGAIPQPRLNELRKVLERLIPYKEGTENGAELNLNGHLYMIESVSQPLDDDDHTWFYNFRINVNFLN